MKTRFDSTKLLAALAVVAIVCVGRFGIKRVSALNPQSLPAAEFGIISIVAGQTARLNAVNFPHNADRAAPGESVQVTLTFFDASGHQILDGTGEPVESTTTLNPGQATFLDLNADLFAPPISKATPQPDPTGCGSGGCMIRPGVTAVQNSQASSQTAVIISTIELVDNSTRRTTVLYPSGPPQKNQD